jgi:hypothetical protein
VGDRAIRLGPNAVVGIPRVGLDLLVPLGSQDRELALVPGLRERIRSSRSLAEAHATDESERDSGPT